MVWSYHNERNQSSFLYPTRMICVVYLEGRQRKEEIQTEAVAVNLALRSKVNVERSDAQTSMQCDSYLRSLAVVKCQEIALDARETAEVIAVCASAI